MGGGDDQGGFRRGVLLGFDHHLQDWGRLLATEDYARIGRLARSAALSCGGGCFAVLEGGYKHSVLGYNVQALLQGLQSV